MKTAESPRLDAPPISQERRRPSSPRSYHQGHLQTKRLRISEARHGYLALAISRTYGSEGKGRIFPQFHVSGRFRAAGRREPAPRGARLPARPPWSRPPAPPGHSRADAPRGAGRMRGRRLAAGWGGRGAALRPIRARGAPASVCVGVCCGVLRCPRTAAAVGARPGARPPSRVMEMKAVCVLKGQGPVEGTIHFVQKARAGRRPAAGGGAAPAHLCPGAASGRASGGPRHAPAAPGLRVRAARGLDPAAGRRPSAESPRGPGGGGGAWRGLGGGAGKARRPPPAGAGRAGARDGGRGRLPRGPRRDVSAAAGGPSLRGRSVGPEAPADSEWRSPGPGPPLRSGVGVGSAAGPPGAGRSRYPASGLPFRPGARSPQPVGTAGPAAGAAQPPELGGWLVPREFRGSWETRLLRPSQESEMKPSNP